MEEKTLVTLAFPSGDVCCEVFGRFDLDENEYVVLRSVEAGNDNFYLFRYIETEDGFTVADIESDEEYEHAENEFVRIIKE